MFNGKTLSTVEDELNRFADSPNNVEVEAKFGSYRKGKFISEVPFRRFHSLKRELSSHDLPSSIEHTRDYRSDTGIRKQVISVEGEEDRVVWQRKSRLRNFDHGPFYNYGVRLSFNSEVTIPPVEDFIHDILRIRHRESFHFGDIKIDMTEIDSQSTKSRKGGGDDSCSYQTKYEVEVEIGNWHITTTEKLKQFNRVLKKVFMELYDTATLYTIPERRNLFKFMNIILGEKQLTVLDFGMVAQARNLKFKDMVWGGLIGNEIKIGGKRVSNHYSVTHKADGVRKFLAIDRTGVWFVFPPEEANLVYRFTKRDHDYSLSGLILDGELVPRERRRKDVGTTIVDKEDIPGVTIYARERRRREKELERFLGFSDAEYWFLVFDALAIDKNKDIQLLPHSQRMNRAYNAVNRMELDANSRLLISFKSFRQIASPEEFFSVMQRMFSEKPILPYHEDGFIFMSGVAPYNPIRRLERQGKRRIPLRERSLTKMPDICKWKPVERLTIDFSITHRPGGKVELLALEGRDKCVPFRGTSIIPFDSEKMVDHEHEMLNPEKYPTKTIIEFRWDFDREMFVPVMARLDKQKPNRMEIAKDDYSDIFDPITQETLEGKNFRLMRKYHNSIKRNLFTKVKSGQYLLDIGSGRGGDVYSWKNFEKIVAVEPDSDHIVELRRRLETQGISDRVRIVQAGGEDAVKITRAVKSFIGEKVDVVSMMFSLTFFWKNERMLNGLVQTIDANLKDNGDIIFTTMDGDTVEEVYDPFFRGIPTRKLVFIRESEDRGFATLRLQPEDERKAGQGRKAYVYIRDSIVGSREIEGPEEVEQLRYDLPVIHSPTRIAISREEVEAELLEEVEPEEVVVEQEEYLVHLDDFERLLSKAGRVVDSKTIYRAENQHFLNEAEKEFSRLYSYGRYTLTSGVGVGLAEEYALWKRVEAISKELQDRYGSRVVGPFKRFNLNNIRVFGDLTNVSANSTAFGSILDSFEKDLKMNGIPAETIVDIIDEVEAEYPLTLEVPTKDIEIEETELPGLLRIGDSYFYVNSDRLDVLLELGDLSEVAKIVLRNYATTLTPSSNLLPGAFVRAIKEMWPGDYLIEAETTPLTSKVLLDRGLRTGHYSSYFRNEKSLGSIGLLEDWVLFETPEETSTTIVALKTPFDVNIQDSMRRYMDLLRSTPEGKHLRVILFVPTNTVESEGPLHEEIVSSGFLLYERSIRVGDEDYHVYVLESSPESKIEDLRSIFENFQDYEIETPNLELINRFTPEGVEAQVI